MEASAAIAARRARDEKQVDGKLEQEPLKCVALPVPEKKAKAALFAWHYEL